MDPTGRTRRNELLEIAQSVVAEHGLDRTTLGEVAERAGVTTPALYTHFKNRDDLLEQVLELTAAEFIDDIRRTDRPDDPVEERLRRRFRRWSRHRRTLLQVLNYAVVAMPESPRIAAAVTSAEQAWRSWVGEVLTRGRERGEVRADLDVAATTDLLSACFLGVQVAATSQLTSRSLGRMLDDLLEMFLAATLTTTR